MKILYILWLCQIKRHLRSKSRRIGSLGQPPLFLLALGYGFGPIFQRAGKGDHIQFPPPGITGMGIIFASIFSGMEMIWDRQFGFLEETQIAQVARAEIMIGRTLGVATVATMQGPLSLLLPFLRNFGRTSGDWCRQRFWS